MIIRYIYRECTQLVGCVYCTDEGKLGYSVVHPNDRKKVTKKLARKIALGRAEKCRIQIDDVFGQQSERWMKMRGNTSPLLGCIVPAAIVPHLAALSVEAEPLIRQRLLDKRIEKA